MSVVDHPKADRPGPIATRDFGLLTEINTPAPDGISDKPGLWQFVFDTGVVLYAPPTIAALMTFELDQA